MAVVLCISSHVLRGHVGNSAAAFALQRLGHDAWALPTITLAHHRGHDRAVPALATPATFIERSLDALDERGWLGDIDAVLVGYLVTAGLVRAVAAAIARIKSARPDAVIALDPVIGDDGALYVGGAVAAAIRKQLLPLADLATPNGFELGWLAGAPAGDSDDAMRQARALGAPECLVTSAPGAPAALVRSLLVTGDSAFTCDVARIEHGAHGAGDLMAALYLGHRLSGAPPQEALARAGGAVQAVLAETAKAGRDELALVAAQQELANPEGLPAVKRTG